MLTLCKVTFTSIMFIIKTAAVHYKISFQKCQTWYVNLRYQVTKQDMIKGYVRTYKRHLFLRNNYVPSSVILSSLHTLYFVLTRQCWIVNNSYMIILGH